jgi:hypothetical protein
MKKLFFGLILLVFLISGIFAEDASAIGDWWGKVTVDGVENNAGAVVRAYINGIEVASANVGQYASKYYLIHVGGITGNNVLFRVNNIDATTVAWTNEDHRLDLTVTSPSSGGGSSGGGSSGGGGGGSRTIPADCYENWQCTDWSDCTVGVQTRQCNDISECDTEVNKPLLSQSCEVDSTAKNNANGFLGITGGVINNLTRSGTGIASLLTFLIVLAGTILIVKKRK